jgi:polyferredoxin
MNDDSDKRLDELFAAARAQTPDTSHVDYGFETRLLARIREEREAAPWYAFAWRLTPVFAAIVVALGAWTYWSPSQDLDLQTVARSNSDESQIVEYLTGKQI